MLAQDRYKRSLNGVMVLLDEDDFGDGMMYLFPPLEQLGIFAKFCQSELVVSQQMSLIIVYNRINVLIVLE